MSSKDGHPSLVVQQSEANYDVCYPDIGITCLPLLVSQMNVERFAGESKVMQKLAADLAANEQLMKQRQAEAMQNAYQARANDVNAAYGRMPNYA